MVTEPYLSLVASGMFLIGGLAGALCLKRAWKARGTNRPAWMTAGWGFFTATIIAAVFFPGGAGGLFMALTIISVSAYAVIATNVELRTARARRDGSKSLAPEPSERPSKAWRGWLRAGLAGPIGMVAAMGCGLAYASLMPGNLQTRLVIGGLLVPILWGGAMAWTLADDKILRATAVLVGVAAVTFAAASIRGFS